MTWQTNQLMAMVNLIICSGIAWACICRLNSEICRRFRLSRARYTLLLGGALASGLQPLLWGSWPTVGAVILAGCVLAGLALNVVRWYGQVGHPMRRKEDL
ncbi:hypothetical protein N0K08_17320 [Acidovorax sp. Be4]|uniref:Holin n=1 Tax=Acidovorax bellezanensis TaxID=2976702 RepID=A0ABT2PPM0_9BURK|nr:hypothetical protein [Acidovorax sp. Be4]MCT9812406.1 hypothetical protein [Acidovorax sp. Be4]